MIAIGCATTDERAFRAAAKPTIELLDEASSLLLRRHRYESIDVAYNDMLAVAAQREDMEAVVLVHQDALTQGGRGAMARIRALLATSPDVAVVGAVDDGSPRELQTVTGTLVVLSPWAVRNLRFDPTVGGSADASAEDISLQARAAGRRVVAAPLGVTRAARRPAPEARRSELRALAAVRRKWDAEALLLG